MAFRLIPREEKFYSDFQALADELQRGARLLEEMLAPEQPDLGQGRRDQGSRAQVRLPDARDHPAAQPHVRHAARSRRHPRAGPLARRRDGRHRRVGDARPALPARHGPLRRARAGAHHHRVAPSRCGSALDALEQQQGRRRRTPSRSTASRTRPTASTRRPSAGCSTTSSDPIVVMKWKETLDFLEEATDRCEDVANVIEGVVVKHG